MQSARLGTGTYHRTRTLWMDLLRPVISTVTTTLTLRLCYAVLTVIGSSLVLPHAQTGESPGLAVPPVPSILHLVHACIAALLLAIQFTPFLRPQDIAEQRSPDRAKVSRPVHRRLALGLGNLVDVVLLALGQRKLGRRAGCDCRHTQLLDVVPAVLVFLCARQTERRRTGRPGAQCVVPQSYRDNLGDWRRCRGAGRRRPLAPLGSRTNSGWYLWGSTTAWRSLSWWAVLTATG